MLQVRWCLPPSPVSSHHQWGRSSSSHSYPSSAQCDSWQSVWHCVTGRGMTWRLTRDTWHVTTSPWPRTGWWWSRSCTATRGSATSRTSSWYQVPLLYYQHHASCRLCSLNIKQKNTRYTRYRFGPLQVLIPGTDKRWRPSTRAVILPACSTAQMEGEAEDNYNHEPWTWTYLNIYIYILNFISFQICFERGELQPDGCCQLSDDPQRIQDDGQSSTEKPSQCSQ